MNALGELAVDLLPVWAIAAVGGALVGLCASFVGINIGLRLMPEGRAFLAAARAEGRVFAHPRRDSAAAVRRVFLIALAGGVVAGIVGFLDLLERLQPVQWPSGKQLAERLS